MNNVIKMNSFAELDQFFHGREILVEPPHEWAGEVCKFDRMVLKDGTVPKPEDKPTADCRMRVKTRFGTDLDLLQKNCFVITEKIRLKPQQDPNLN